jgi:hypothetical protein
MFNFIDIYSFIPVSGCVGRGHRCTGLTIGDYNAVKTALAVSDTISFRVENFPLYQISLCFTTDVVSLNLDQGEVCNIM